MARHTRRSKRRGKTMKKKGGDISFGEDQVKFLEKTFSEFADDVGIDKNPLNYMKFITTVKEIIGEDDSLVEQLKSLTVGEVEEFTSYGEFE
jgi:hypothetical protein